MADRETAAGGGGAGSGLAVMALDNLETPWRPIRWRRTSRMAFGSAGVQRRHAGVTGQGSGNNRTAGPGLRV